MAKLLTKKELTKKLKALGSEWSLNAPGTTLTRKLSFKNYLEAFIFATRIVVHAEAKKHHPTIHLSYGSLTIILTTHEVKGISDNDIELAATVNKLAELSTVSSKRNR